MTIAGPQFLYLILILPTLFGLTLVGEGFFKVIHGEWHGLINVLCGAFFIGAAGIAYFIFSNYLANHI